MEPNQTQNESAPVPLLPPSKKTGRFGESYALIVQGLKLFEKDKFMVLFPIFSIISIIVPMAVYCFFSVIVGNSPYDFFSVNYGVLLILYLFVVFVTAFFQAGLTAVVDARIHGRSMTFQEGLGVAFGAMEKIFLWSLVFVMTGALFMLLSFILGKPTDFIVSVLSTLWGIVTFFIVPALILEKGNIFECLKTSADTFKKIWGETIIVNFSLLIFAWVAVLLGLILIASLLILSHAFLPVLVAVPFLSLLLVFLILFVVGIMLFSVTINQILRVVLYEYAKKEASLLS